MSEPSKAPKVSAVLFGACVAVLVVGHATACQPPDERSQHNAPIDVEKDLLIDIYRDEARGVTCYRVMQGLSCVHDLSDGGFDAR